MSSKEEKKRKFNYVSLNSQKDSVKKKGPSLPPSHLPAMCNKFRGFSLEGLEVIAGSFAMFVNFYGMLDSSLSMLLLMIYGRGDGKS